MDKRGEDHTDAEGCTCFEIYVPELRYVIIDFRKSGDINTDILERGISKDEAVKKLDASWSYLTGKEKKGSVMSLALMAVQGDEVIADGSEGYDEAIARGWDTLAGYSPIETREA